MPSQLISFRFSDDEAEVLSAHQLPGESLNLTAQRVLRKSLGLSTAVNNAVDRVNRLVDTVDSSDLDERIKEVVNQRTAYLAQHLNARLEEYEEKLGQLQESLGKYQA